MTERASSQRSVAAQVWFVPLEVYNAAGDGGNALIAPIPAFLALSGVAAYAQTAVKQPSINVEKEPKSLHELFMQVGIQAGIDRSAEISRRMKSGEIRFPKGVFRFKTVEEADEWKNKILAGN